MSEKIDDLELAVVYELSLYKDFHKTMENLSEVFYRKVGGVKYGETVDTMNIGESASIVVYFRFHRRDRHGSLIRDLKLDFNVPWVKAEFPEKPFYVPRKIYPMKLTIEKNVDSINSIHSSQEEGQPWVVCNLEGVKSTLSGTTSLLYGETMEKGKKVSRKVSEVEVVENPEKWADVKGNSP